MKHLKHTTFLGLGFALVVMTGVASAQTQTDQLALLYPAQVGAIPCDGSVVVTIAEEPKNPNHYDIAIGKMHYEAERVATKSGAIKLEDQKDGIIWLQMSNKSMLIDEKHHKRLAVDCQDANQKAVQKELDAVH